MLKVRTRVSNEEACAAGASLKTFSLLIASPILLLQLGCDALSPEAQRLETEPLRVAASAALTEASFGVGKEAGLSREQELAFSLAAGKLAVKKVDGNRVQLIGLSVLGTEIDYSELASQLRFDGLVSAESTGESIDLSFSSDKAGKEFASGFTHYALLEDGPFKPSVSRVSSSALELEPRDGERKLRLVLAAESNHWQLLLGGHVDAVSALNQSQAAHLRPVGGVLIKKFPAERLVAITFNPHRVGIGARLAVQRAQFELATAKCGDGDCLAKLPGQLQPFSAFQDVEVENKSFTLLTLEGRREDELAARSLVAAVWRRSSIAIELRTISLNEYAKLFVRSDFDAVLSPVGSSPGQFYGGYLEEPLASLSFSKTEPPGLAIMVANKNWEALAEYLVQHAHAVPVLWETRFAAIGEGWCFGEDPSRSLRWVASLTRCADRDVGK